MATTSHPAGRRRRDDRLRFACMLIMGVAAGVVANRWLTWMHAVVVGWTVAAVVFDTWTWLRIARMDAATTADHAAAEDPSRGVRELLMLGANVAALAAIVMTMHDAAGASHRERVLLSLLLLGTAAASWLLVHTLFTLRYAAIYFGKQPVGGIDFNEDITPTYLDIAYMAFSVGMTFQVSDTSLTTHSMRVAVLEHSLLAFVFGAGILATTINLVVTASA